MVVIQVEVRGFRGLRGDAWAGIGGVVTRAGAPGYFGRAWGGLDLREQRLDKGNFEPSEASK